MKKKIKEKKEFTQNETVTFKNVNYSITKVERTNGKEFFEANDGKEYILISIKIENKSSEKISYNSLDWKLTDSKGDEQTYALWGTDNNTTLGSGDLNPKGTKEGSIAFEIKKGDNNLILKFYETILHKERTFEFKLNK